MNKNWNDRADKDLFFTILSVKNIGVISGSEWTTIGNHMRSLGYGFTNEGCRQHFQGLRRAQHKAESSNGSVLDSQRNKSDPTENPITRRPGPGRGRPRKLPPNPVPNSEQSASQSAEASTSDPSDQMNPSGVPVSMSMQVPVPVQETDSLSLVQDDTELEEQPSKRPRLDAVDQDQNDDEAVLALAAHGLPGADDHYGNSDYYGEA
ncbi:hypothetical protein F4809DRAFT_318863 [Biscogniauxia mediterranea]|nr:hypothetical protein F4809DRAFT_318863 [Biscogniauxia mediterranea]